MRCCLSTVTSGVMYTTKAYNTTAPCTSSGYRTVNNTCDFALDGNLETQWKAKDRNGIEDWLEVSLEEARFMVAVGFDSGCVWGSQCTRWRLTFSEGTEKNVCLFIFRFFRV